jgi:hypothetical protein
MHGMNNIYLVMKLGRGRPMEQLHMQLYAANSGKLTQIILVTFS